jgi:hypothetical protein
VARVIVFNARVRKQSNEAAVDFIRQVLREVRFQARLHVAFGPYTTGNLARSIEVDGPHMEFAGATGSVGSRLSYAAAVEAGARPHVIRPVNGRFLKFYWRKVGRVVYLEKVNHPGQRGKEYLLRAAESVAIRHRMLWVAREI